jgi:hypothetical protein
LLQTEKLKEVTLQKLVEYEKNRIEINAKKQEIIKKLDEEEKVLIKKLDSQIVEDQL